MAELWKVAIFKRTEEQEAFSCCMRFPAQFAVARCREYRRRIKRFGLHYHWYGVDGGPMATRHRHTATQIAAKLATADEMSAQGRLHGDIAKSLGVSVMTYHRWRKARGTVMNTEPPEFPRDCEQASQIRDLQHENSRLRRFVADLLLERVKLEEDLRGSTVQSSESYAQLTARPVDHPSNSVTLPGRGRPPGLRE